MSTLPTQLGPYEIIREIARSNDIVYEAFDPRMNRRVAVKELAIPSGATDPQTRDRIARFEREARAVGMLNHPNIMTVYTTGEDAGRVYMAMEFLDGVSLRKELDTLGTIPLDRAVEIALETLDGLAHAHAHGVVHRDIKPDNVQIVSSGQVKITDFGIARLTFQPNLTLDGQVFGTPSYMSPEQVVGKEIDARSDLFSVGVMLYEMLAGVKPFAGDSVVTITYNIVNVAPNPSPQIPHAIWKVVQTAMDKAPSARYADAKSMRHALASAVEAARAPEPPAAPWLVGAPTSPYAPPVIGTPSPFGTPLPTTGQAPYGAPNPYGAANPYGTSAFNNSPYGTAPYGGQFSGGQFPGGQFPGLTAPIYYPAPPRPPLLKPETTRAIGRFVAILGILALLFVILFVAFQTIVDKAIRHPETKVSPSSTSGKVAATSAGASSAAPPKADSSPLASRELATLDAQCRAGGTAECQEVLDRINAHADNLDGDSRLRMGAAALAGTGKKQEAVMALLLAAQMRKMGDESNARIRELIFDAENAAKGDPSLEQEVANTKSQLNVS